MPPPVGLVDNGDGKPSVHDTRTGGPREVVPSLATGWSHHWRQGGPITGDEMVPSHWRNSRQVVPSHWRATPETPAAPGAICGVRTASRSAGISAPLRERTSTRLNYSH